MRREPQIGGLAPASRLGPYEIISLIGAGGMGEVYRARDTRLGRDVAIKVLPAEFASDPNRSRRFENEARAVGALNHPNILAVHDIGTHHDTPYLVTELLEGETLRARLHGGALPLRRAIEYAVQIGEGLAAAHDKGIVHRDLKPGNIFITNDGHIKLLDFGLAKAVASRTSEERNAAGKSETLTDEGRVVGTAAYMSPEQVKGLPVDHRSDLFSLGVVLYEMVTGKQAFGRDSTAETMAAILKEEPPDSSGLSPAVPVALSRVIAHCLEKRLDERYQSARDLTFELKAILADTTGIKVVRPRAKKRVALAAGAALAVAVIGGGIWLQRQPRAALRVTNLKLLSTFPGSHRWPTFSPDGSMIAFISDADGSSQIWVKNLAGGDPIRITSGRLNPSHPAWSPKNDQIIFQGGEDFRSQSIWSVPPLGGPHRRLLEGGVAPSFSNRGTRIAFHRGPMGIFTCKADGTDVQALSGGPNTLGTNLDDGPVYSADGKTLAIFLLGPSAFPQLWLAPTRGGEWSSVLMEPFEARHPVWTRDSSAIIFSSPRGGARNLWALHTSDRSLEPITTGTGDDEEPAISRDGRKLAYTNTRGSYALMALDMATGISREVLEQRSRIVDARYSPSGDKLALELDAKEGNRLVVVGSDGVGMRSIGAEGDDVGYMPQWAPDGKDLYFFRSRPTSSFRTISVAGGPSRELAPRWTGEASPTWQVSPDGRRVAYSVLREGKAVAANVLDLVAGTKTALPVVLFLPRWSHDGRVLVGCTQQFNNRVFVCPPSGAPCTTIVTRSTAGPPFWSVDDATIFFPAWKRSSPDCVELWRVGRDGTGESLVAELTSVARPDEFVSEASSHGLLPWVQFRPGRREMWLAELKP